MEVELWLDVSCPWCRGALPVMKQLLAQEAPRATLEWRPIRLHRLDLAGKALPRLSEDLLEFNRSRGRPLDVERLRWLHHPDLAHRLMALCRSRADVDMWALAEALWEANWVSGLDITSAAQLAPILPVPAEVWERIGEAGALVEADHQRAVSIGLDGVPRFYLNGTIVPAWLDVDVVRDKLRVALGE